MDEGTDKFQYSLKFKVLTDVFVAHLPDWTWGHQQDHILRGLWSAAAWTPVKWTTLSRHFFQNTVFFIGRYIY